MGDQTPYWILLIAVVVALIALWVGLNVLRDRRHRSEGEHLQMHIANPETLADPHSPLGTQAERD